MFIGVYLWFKCFVQTQALITLGSDSGDMRDTEATKSSGGLSLGAEIGPRRALEPVMCFLAVALRVSAGTEAFDWLPCPAAHAAGYTKPMLVGCTNIHDTLG